MLVTELLLHTTRTFFFLLAVITVADYLRHRDRIRRDIALVFISLTMGNFVGFVVATLGLQIPLLTKVGALAVVSQPYLLVRLVPYFRPLPRIVMRVALIGLLASWVILILIPTPLPPPLAVILIAYFIAVDGYAMYAFIRGAFSSAGVARHRLRFAAFGSALLILLFFIAGIRIFIAGGGAELLPLIQLFSVVCALGYYLGFAPPRWLRQGWLFTELRNYLLRDFSKSSSASSMEILENLRQAVIRAMGTPRVVVALWDKDGEKLLLQDTADTPLLSSSNLSDGIIRQSWQGEKPIVAYKSAGLDGEDLRLMQSLKAEALFIVPIGTSQDALGVLLVFLEYGSLFVDDDLSLLTIFAQQTAMLLENNNVLEQQRRYAEDLERQVQQRTRSLQRSNEELKQFAYVASHDLQEPLRTVASYMGLIADRYVDKLDSDAREFIDFAVDGAMRMKNLIDGLLAYSRVEMRQQNFKRVDFQKVVDDVRLLLKASIEQSGAAITNDPMPKIDADEELIGQVFQNLVSNAIKYQKDRKPEIHIGATHENKEWIFSVQDNGIGIEPQYLERIFVIFQRLHNRNEYPGTGIGLAVCKRVIEDHNGRIWAESEYGKGTTFYFSIPG